MVAGFLLLVSLPVVVAGWGDRVIKSTYIRASDNSQKKSQILLDFWGQNRGKIGRFRGNFQGKLVDKLVKLVDKPIQSPTFLSLLEIDLMDFHNCPCDCTEKHTWAMNITDHHTK